ncbi:MAG: hypothetical protein AAGU11_12860 [Syntrophobacteraceae bacterium]
MKLPTAFTLAFLLFAMPLFMAGPAVGQEMSTALDLDRIRATLGFGLAPETPEVAEEEAEVNADILENAIKEAEATAKEEVVKKNRPIDLTDALEKLAKARAKLLETAADIVGDEEVWFMKFDEMPKKFAGATAFGVPVAEEGLKLDFGMARLARGSFLEMKLEGLKMADGSIPMMELEAMVSCLEPSGEFNTFRSSGAFFVDQSGNAVHEGSLDMQGHSCFAPRVFALTPDGKAFVMSVP